MPEAVPHTVEYPAGAIAVPVGENLSHEKLDVEDLTVLTFPPEAEPLLLYLSVVKYTITRAEDAAHDAAGPAFVSAMFRAQRGTTKNRESTTTNSIAVAILHGFHTDLTRACRLGLDDWAEQLEIPPEAISSAIRSETGMTFHRWRTEVRMDFARHLLFWGNSPGKVRSRLGYASPSSFANAFIRTHGILAREYQRRHRITDVG